MSLLQAALRDGASKRPSSAALSDGNTQTSYADLDRLVRSVADQWQRLGLRSVALLADNSS
ncbi:MAG: hypothetical protein ABIR55_11935, partial [Burkholderiaceae bacterium]